MAFLGVVILMGAGAVLALVIERVIRKIRKKRKNNDED